MGGDPNAPGPSPTLRSLGPSHQWHHKSRASLRGPPCAHGVAGTPQGEVRDNDGVVVACGIAAVVNRSKDNHYEVLAVVLYALDLLLDVPCVELWDIVYFVPEEDIALLLRYSKRILCYLLLELPQVTIAVSILFKEGCIWIGILEWLDVMLCQ